MTVPDSASWFVTIESESNIQTFTVFNEPERFHVYITQTASSGVELFLLYGEASQSSQTA